MRRWSLFLAVALAACLPTAEDPLDPETTGADAGYVFEDETDPDAVAEVDEAAEVDPELAAEEATEPELDEEQAANDGPQQVDLNADARRRCERRNGAFTKTPAGLFICVRQTRDANKSCTAANQCQGACLARSRTCAPFTPLIGCHDLITSTGVATVCVD